MATVSFSSPKYIVGESADTLQVTLTRSGETETAVVVLVASDAIGGNASGINKFRMV